MGREPHPGAFSVEEAQERFKELLERAAAGEEVIIMGEDGALRLSPVEVKPMTKRLPGLWKGKFEVPDSFFDPLSEEELALWYGDDSKEDC